VRVFPHLTIPETASVSKRDLLSTEDLADDELINLLELADRMKRRGPRDLLKGRMLGLLFRDPSLRTRVSFDVALSQLGGRAIALSAEDAYGLEAMPDVKMDGKAEEHVKDAALALSKYLDGLGLRESRRTGSWIEDREDPLLRAYAEHASIPVINLQSHMYHPCQALADAQDHARQGARTPWPQHHAGLDPESRSPEPRSPPLPRLDGDASRHALAYRPSSGLRAR
jgi:N-acetylornithine carbamoyltransferase